MCSHQTFCSITMHCITNFLRGYKTYFILITFFKEKYKASCMPSFRRAFINSIKLFSGLNSSKIFYFANNFNLIKKTYTASLFLPFARLAEITFLPFLVFILVLNPCVLFLGVLCGWYVLFIPIS